MKSCDKRHVIQRPVQRKFACDLTVHSSGYQANDKIKERRNGNNLIAAGEENGKEITNKPWKRELLWLVHGS